MSTTLASPKGTIPTYAAPGATSNGKTGLWYGYAMTLPVIAQQAGWLEVRLPQRPNGLTAWVQTSDVTLSTSSYRIVISVGGERLRVYQNGYQTMDFPVGVGTPSTPTPTGHFFVTVRVPPPNSAYGPFVVSTSAHSEAISSWDGAGDALIGIHGPISSWADSRIGTGDARVSNGCVRMHDADLAQLAVIPAGTPVDIVA